MYLILSGKTNANVLSTNRFQFCKKFPYKGVITISSSVTNILARTGPKGDLIATPSTPIIVSRHRMLVLTFFLGKSF